jgi:predicted GH43/DUF377 family glycosyl hydrolase
MMRRTWLFVIMAAIVLFVPMAVAVSAPQAAWIKDAANPVFQPKPADGWDNRNVYAAKVLYDGGVFFMWYTADGYSDTSPRIGYATSSDGKNWNRHQTPVLSPGPGWEVKGVSAPTVLYKDNTWHMWYAGRDLSHYSIGYATSTDRINWTKYAGNPVLSPGAEGSPDDLDTVSPYVIFKDNLFHMWYAGRGDSNQIFYATSSDGIQWMKHAANPVLRLGGDFEWDNGEIAAPSVLWTGAQYEMWYQGYSRGTLQRYVGHATSPDGVAWTKDALNPVLGLEPGKWDSFSVYYPSVLLGTGGQTMLWYQGEAGEGQQKQIGLATFQLDTTPTPLPTFPTESPIDSTATPTASPTLSGPATDTPTPTVTWTPIPVECGADGRHCVLMPSIRK